VNNLLITGAGCSGTGYISRLLTEWGYPCGHEAVYNPRAVIFGNPTWPSNPHPDLVADASWLPTFNLAGVRGPIALQLRDPLQVALSYLQLGFYNWDDQRHGRYRAVVAAHCPQVFAASTEHERILRHIYFAYMSSISHAEMAYTVEGMNIDTARALVEMMDLIPSDAPLLDISHTTNTHHKTANDPADIIKFRTLPIWNDLYALYRQWYEVPY